MPRPVICASLAASALIVPAVAVADAPATDDDRGLHDPGPTFQVLPGDDAPVPDVRRVLVAVSAADDYGRNDGGVPFAAAPPDDAPVGVLRDRTDVSGTGTVVRPRRRRPTHRRSGSAYSLSW